MKSYINFSCYLKKSPNYIGGFFCYMNATKTLFLSKLHITSLYIISLFVIYIIEFANGYPINEATKIITTIIKNPYFNNLDESVHPDEPATAT